jgi:hypothetical protein
MNKIMITLLLVAITNSVYAQEFDVEVTVNMPQSAKTEKEIIKKLETDVADFFNKTKFTSDEFKQEEKINAKITITIIEELNNNAFTSEISIQSSRPVYNSDYSTTALNYLDKGVTFGFFPGQVIQLSDKSFVDNLSYTLSFYAYIMLGFDYDSFSQFGGEEYFQTAFTIFNNLPSGLKSDDLSWTNRGVNGRSKYFLIENLLSPKLRQFRQMFYEYHRLSLDNMWEDAEKNRAAMLSSLGMITEFQTQYPNSFLLQVFGDTKYNEVIEIFRAADSGQKKKVKDLMTLTSPALASRYDSLK